MRGRPNGRPRVFPTETSDSYHLSLDYETRSLDRAARHRAVRLRDGPEHRHLVRGLAVRRHAEPELWHPGEPVPQRIIDHVAAGGIIRAHNAAFERLITQYVATPRYGWPACRCGSGCAARPKRPRCRSLARSGSSRRCSASTCRRTTTATTSCCGCAARARYAAMAHRSGGTCPSASSAWAPTARRDVQTEKACTARCVVSSPSEQEMYY
jgi:hypothetical protein